MCIVDQVMHEDAEQDVFLRSLSSFLSGAAFSNAAVEPWAHSEVLGPTSLLPSPHPLPTLR